MKREIPALTGLRGIAALWVFLFHALTTFRAGAPVLAPVGTGGFLGVDIFFVLSGFVLALNYADAGCHRSPASYGGFLWKRLARIYPVHLVALLLLVVLVAVFAAFGIKYLPASRLTGSGLIRTLTLTHGWDLPIGKTWNTVSWSISCEWAAYLAFPFLNVMAMRLSSPMAIRIAILLLFAGLGLFIDRSPSLGTMAYGMPRIAAEFTAGVLLYRFWEVRKFEKSEQGDLIALFSFAIMIGGSNYLGSTRAMALMPVLACALVYGLAIGNGIVCRALSGRLALFGGKVSYAFYMVHVLLLGVAYHVLRANGWFGDPVIALGSVALAGLVTFAVAAGIYAAIETPARRAMVGWWSRYARSTQEPEPSASSPSAKPSSAARI